MGLYGASSDRELSGTRVGNRRLPWRTGGVQVTPSAFRLAPSNPFPQQGG